MERRRGGRVPGDDRGRDGSAQLPGRQPARCQQDPDGEPPSRPPRGRAGRGRAEGARQHERPSAVASRSTCRRRCRVWTWTPRSSSARSRTSHPTPGRTARPDGPVRILDRRPAAASSSGSSIAVRASRSTSANACSSRSSGWAIALRRRGGSGARGRSRVRRGDGRRGRVEDTPGGRAHDGARVQGGGHDDASWSSTTNRRSSAAWAPTCARGATTSRRRPTASGRWRWRRAPIRMSSPGSRSPRDRRGRCDPGAARVDRDPDHRPVGARPRAGQGRGARRRRRRLRVEAVRDG